MADQDRPAARARPQDDNPHRKPNPLADAIGRVVGRLRADDDMWRLLQAYDRLDPDAIEKVDVATARVNPTIDDAMALMLREQDRPTELHAVMPGASTAEVFVPGAEGPLAATCYRPDGVAGLLPVVLYFHGGGWVIADRHVYDGGARGLCLASQALVLSVDYRQAPEHRFPAAWDDAIAVYRWLCSQAQSLGGDPMRLALAGESAGGNLAVATAIAARDAALPMPRHVVAVYPVAQTGLNTESYLENALARPLNRAMVEWFVDKLIRDPSDLKDPRLQLVDAELGGLCPVSIITARIDPLRSDGARLEQALKKAGVATQRRDYEGVTHEFFGCAPVLAKARDAQQWAGLRLREAFGTPAGPTPG